MTGVMLLSVADGCRNAPSVTNETPTDQHDAEDKLHPTGECGPADVHPGEDEQSYAGDHHLTEIDFPPGDGIHKADFGHLRHHESD